MYSICYIIPYFGKLPLNFQLWLNSCEKNPTIDWMIFTNDTTKYNIPNNVHMKYCEFEKIQELIQKNYDFEIKIDKYWCLSLFKPAYGEIFQEYLKEYDFWGHCDVDLIWGNIRKFVTNEILDKYEKIGFQGHSTLYKNMKEVNERYKTVIPGKTSYIDVFSGRIIESFDEKGMEDIYNYLQIPYYKDINFAHLSIRHHSFWLYYLPEKDDYKNRRQIFTWENGNLTRMYLEDNAICNEEYMYIHFFTRPMKYKATGNEIEKKYVIYPDIVDVKPEKITVKYIKKKGYCSKVAFYIKSLYYNRHKLSLERIIKRIKLLNNKWEDLS